MAHLYCEPREETSYIWMPAIAWTRQASWQNPKTSIMSDQTRQTSGTVPPGNQSVRRGGLFIKLVAAEVCERAFRPTQR